MFLFKNPTIDLSLPPRKKSYINNTEQKNYESATEWTTNIRPFNFLSLEKSKQD